MMKTLQKCLAPVVFLFVFILGLVAAEAQTTPPAPAGQTTAAPETPVLGFSATPEMLRDLPLNNNPLAILETIEPETTSDRFLSAGLNVATAPRFGSLLSSWTQTQVRIGDISITDPRTGGTSLFLPILPQWQRVSVQTASMGLEESAPGLSMTLEPRRPGTSWFHAIEASGSGGFLVSDQSGPVPAIDRLNHGYEGSALISGPLTDRLGLVAAGWWRGSSHVARAQTISSANTSAGTQTALSDQVVSGFATMVYRATPVDDVRVVGWVQHLSSDTSTDAFFDTRTNTVTGMSTNTLTDTAVHIQGTWERHDDPTKAAWRVFAGYTDDQRTLPPASTLVIDSTTSDPVSDLIDPPVGTARRWTVGARLVPPAEKTARANLSFLPLPTIGATVDGAEMQIDPTGISQVQELVNGLPARVWNVHAGTATDVRHLTTLGAYANEHVMMGRVTVDAGIRLDATTGSADGAAQGVGWASWLPRLMLRTRITDKYGLALTAGYRRSAYQLPLNVLAFGDPAAPFADVSLWNGAATGPLIARVGPGTGGDSSFAQIDPQLKRPITDELLLALESRPTPWLKLQASGIVKREQSLLEVLDTGVDPTAYGTIHVADPSALVPSPLTVYVRPANAYGRDRYLLTNRTDGDADFWGMVDSIEIDTARLVIHAQGAVWTGLTGPAAAVGARPTENDQDVLGNLFVDPNGVINSRGQLFQDRTHTVKIAVISPLPWGVRLGAIAR
ncbi:MAG TPA: hypothetical protein VNZ26_21780, partial [Vicinamibacterales bacterium]|nr:hypothetical protein [Vicinamibacterales bacterium]